MAARDGGRVLQQERKALAELDDEAGPDLARKIDLDESDVGAGEPRGWRGAWFGHRARMHEVEIFGPNIPVTEVAQNAETIAWEIFTGITSRVARCYKKLSCN